MSNNSFEVNSLNHFISIIKSKKLNNYLFRGENDEYPYISSSFLRKYNPELSKHQMPNFYDNLINSYYEEIAINLNEFERSNFIAFSQHHGLATNLIDFTTSPLVALYFACDREYTQKSTGFVYLIQKSNTINISELINNLFIPPKANYNIIDLFTNGHETVVNYFKKHLNSYFWEHDILAYLQDMYTCCEEIASSVNLSKTFIDKYKSLYPSGEHIKLFKQYFSKLDIKGSYDNLNYYLTILHLYFNDLSLSSYFTDKDKKVSFPNMPYCIYKTPYKFDRIRNQEGIFIYQLYKRFGLKHEDVFDDIAIQKIVPEITIKVHNQKDILDQLDFIGINRKYIYGDYDNIAQYLNNRHF